MTHWAQWTKPTASNANLADNTEALPAKLSVFLVLLAYLVRSPSITSSPLKAVPEPEAFARTTTLPVQV